MGTFEASSKWAGLPVKLSLNADGKKTARKALKRLTEAFAQQAQLYSTLTAYRLEHIRKHNGIRTKNDFFCQSVSDSGKLPSRFKAESIGFCRSESLYRVSQ